MEKLVLDKTMKIPLFWPAIYKNEWLEELGKVFDTRWIGQGPLVDKFEREFGKKFGFDYCISVNSGTAALELAYHLLGIGQGWEVLTPVFTCVYGEEKIELPSGKNVFIRHLVNKKYNGLIKCLNTKTGKIELQKVVGWIKRPIGDKKWIRITYKNAPNSVSSFGKRGLWVTEDHRILTRRGWVEAGQVEKNDQIATTYRDFSNEQAQTFVGTMLGDGSIRFGRKEGTSCRFHYLHSFKQKDLVEIKNDFFNGFPNKVVKKSKYKQSGEAIGTIYGSSPLWKRERSRWYKNGKKIVPKDLSKQELTDRSIAMWYMDDGSKTKSAAILCTDNFTYEENKRLVLLLTEVGIKAKVQIAKRNDKKIYRIYIGNGNNGGKKGINVDKFYMRVAPYIVEGLRYKLPNHISKDPNYRYAKVLWEKGNRTHIFYDKAVIVRNGEPNNLPRKKKYVYCLEVENNHNFVARDIIIHNCTATNIPLLRRGAKLTFLDVNDKLVVDYKDLKRKISKNVKAIVVATIGGIRIDNRIFKLAKEHGIPVVIDAAQSVGIEERSGNYVCYSFQAIKHFTTGDGGMLVVRNKKEYKRAKKLRWFGIDREAKKRADWRWEINHKMALDIEEAGYKFHMNDISAAMGLVGLRHSDEALRYRRKLCNQYAKLLPKHKVIYGGAYWLVAILVNDRGKLMDKLKRNGIESDPIQIRNDAFSIFRQKAQVPMMDKLEDKYLYLPLHPKLSVEDIEYIVKVIKK